MCRDLQLASTRAGQPAQSFDGLTASSALKSLNWFGFVSDANEAAVLYLDNVVIKPQGSLEAR
jgi:hypothetical protein